MHHGIMLGRIVALGAARAEDILGGGVADEFAGGINEVDLEDDDGLTMIVEVTVVVTVSLLSPVIAEDAAGGSTVDVKVVVTCIVL